MEFSDMVGIVSRFCKCIKKIFFKLFNTIFKNYFPFSNTNLAFSDIETACISIY